ncbi:MAG: HAD family hydrolase, partial [Phascolarctobacterium sp.]|nr:HAD family hydrolase [Phascolarctobacterium sp.]
MAFDKTGTLTEGKLEVSDIIPFRGMQEAELLYLAAGAEAKSEHPLARAIVARAVDIPESTAFRVAAGRGVDA